MAKPKDYSCSCGRPSQVDVDGVYMCWELYLIDEPEIWKAKYSGQTARHIKENDNG